MLHVLSMIRPSSQLQMLSTEETAHIANYWIAASARQSPVQGSIKIK